MSIYLPFTVTECCRPSDWSQCCFFFVFLQSKGKGLYGRLFCYPKDKCTVDQCLSTAGDRGPPCWWVALDGLQKIEEKRRKQNANLNIIKLLYYYIWFCFHNDRCADLHNDVMTVSGAELTLITRSWFVDGSFRLRCFSRTDVRRHSLHPRGKLTH